MLYIMIGMLRNYEELLEKGRLSSLENRRLQDILILISRNIMSSTKLFADDMKLYRLLRDTKEDVEELQKDLIRLESWSHVWQLKFNTDKCEAMRISKKNDYSSPQYHLCGNQLKAVSEVKDLGIYITLNLSWSMQANKCANKAN